MKTDAQIQLDVIAELKWEPSVKATDIGVSVKDRIVTLTGHVDTFAEKWHAEKAAQRVSDVKAIAVEMDVKLAAESQKLDVDIARTAENVLDWIIVLPKNKIKLLVEKGWVTLSGEVDWDFQRHVAANAVRYLMGVTGVSNQISLNPKLSSSTIKSDIEAALARRAFATTPSIHVDVMGANVTLTGSVHNLNERDLVTRSAWASPGVKKVTDHLTITHAYA